MVNLLVLNLACARCGSEDFTGIADPFLGLIAISCDECKSKSIAKWPLSLRPDGLPARIHAEAPSEERTPEMKTEQRVAENRLRRIAERSGLRLFKSRSRDTNAIDFGLYAIYPSDALVSAPTNYKWTARDVTEYLSEPAL